MNKDILICGVGGQGTVLASKIIAASAMEEGNTVHSAETIGIVTCHNDYGIFPHLPLPFFKNDRHSLSILAPKSFMARK